MEVHAVVIYLKK